MRGFAFGEANLIRRKLLIDSRKGLSMVAAAKIEGRGSGAVDRSGLTGVQANLNAGGLGFDVVSIPDHRLDIALTVAGHEEGDDVLVANGLENRLISRYRP